jgi:LacI family transcriptional regulator
MKTNVGLLEIAKLANVSLGTVDRAIHNRGRVGAETRKRILGIAQQLGYKPNLAARALSVGPNAIPIAVCLPREIRYYFDQLRDGIFDEARHFEYAGLQLHYVATERLGMGEASAVQTMIDQQPRALIITPGDPESIAPLIDEAEERNIRVVCVASDAPRSRRSTVVTVDATVAGGVAADLLGRLGPPDSEVAVVTGMLQIEDHRRTVDTFTHMFEQICPNGKVAEVIEDHESEQEAYEKCFRILADNSALTGFYVTTANCLPVCRAITKLNLTQKIRIIASDLFLEMVPYFDMGVIAASIYGRPFAQGRLAVKLIVDHIMNGRHLRPKYYIAPQIITRASMHLFRETQTLRARDREATD